jgi:hypothetical protein
MKTMKTVLAIITLALGLALSVSAVEYKTLKNGESLVISPTSLVEITSHGSEQVARIELTFSSGTAPTEMFLNGMFTQGGGFTAHSGRRGHIITDALKIKILDSFVTVKITPEAEINAAGPTSVLVLPENAQGNYDLTVESSSDLATWTPIHSQTVQSNTTSRMFRVRITKK